MESLALQASFNPSFGRSILTLTKSSGLVAFPAASADLMQSLTPLGYGVAQLTLHLP